MVPHPKAIEAWNAIRARYSDRQQFLTAVRRFIDGVAGSGVPEAGSIAESLWIRLRLTQRGLVDIGQWPAANAQESGRQPR